MKQPPETKPKQSNNRLASVIEKKAKARQKVPRLKSIWLGFTFLSTVSLFLIAPTLGGIYLGRYLEETIKSGPNWILTGLFTGLIIGSLAAWNWIKRKGIEENLFDKEEDIKEENDKWTW